MVNLSSHPLIKQSYDVSRAIEACGASPALTASVIKSGELTEAIAKTVVGRWKIAKATPEQEAWAKRMANR